MGRPNFIPSKLMDFSSKIQTVVHEHDCARHDAPVGIPCFQLRTDTRFGLLSGICNGRAKKMFNGVPSTRFQKENR